MFSRTLCAFCLLASPAAAELITISSGYHDRINITDDRELLMTGGTIEYLNAAGGLSTIKGGRITTSRAMRGANVVIEGTSGPIDIETRDGGAKITVHGYQFRLFTYGVTAGNQSAHRIEAWLLDGSYTNVHLLRHSAAALTRFELVQHDPTFLDPDRDWDFDLADLNFLRNNFGATSDGGDTNFDGVLDLADLNIARNHFGDGFYLGPEHSFSGVIPLTAAFPVPEPSSWLLAASGLLIVMARAMLAP